MTQECDWFKHKPFSQSNGEITSAKKISSSYSRRNEMNNWFTHSQTKEPSSHSTSNYPVRSRVKYEGVEYAIRDRVSGLIP